MRRSLRFAAGATLGVAALAAYLAYAGPHQVLDRATAVAPWAVAVVAALVVCEAVVDGVGVWASVRPLNGGISPRRSVQFALAGDFFDVLSPAGPVSSEPIMARFFGVETGTGYSEALGVRGVAKYVKSGAQLLVSTALVAVLLLDGVSPRYVLVTLGGAVGVLALGGVVLVGGRGPLDRAVVVLLSPVVRVISGLYREDPHGHEVVVAAVERFWTRALAFREAPRLVALIALGGVLEQLLTASALWVALAGTGSSVALIALVAVIPLPQAASVVPVPGSLGAYDVLLAGALVVVTGVPSASAAAAVLVVRTFGLATALGVGGLATAFLRGWTPRGG
ncbi:lysylphosphatidylglycerol synthase domain-containing protein [Halobaculum marinum]|uniref:Lysylphosphatidylglycerol synthase domain-containing protein n=1 Tax=Halobaculum marinum TaxID=3031996 RepID=A0ABD5X329_9EURY|nr:lysylphosphatidylglycerol synthase domain-containing protein [Halobaculum sp. DT55]